ncbi:hypothetical protein BCR34DRAFT_493832 [Clohesyomyces aquaticus]|uniref:MARVEL domain-containing protein n=1 Tax=Clohesyomyces aquaticus TaxID=1231657 RepID=A0A1Y1YV91_9PLEO|nr:hypothetical protein BCR34DRAFT_493832 [Clohesyomyces aquaticus]
MAVNVLLPIRGLQVAMSVAVLGMMAYVASWWGSHWRQFSPTEINFMIFSPVWTLLALAALVIVPWKMPYVAQNKVPKMALLGIECLTMLFWFSGFIALAVFLSDRICFGTVCSVAKAGTAISAFQWAAFVASFILQVMAFMKRGSGMGSVEPKVEMHQGV